MTTCRTPRGARYSLLLKLKYHSNANVFDAIGLAVFTVSGMNAAMPVSDNVILVLFVGMCTGVGGGMLRDVMTNTMPKVLRKRVYAVASLIGGGLYYVMHVLDINQLLSVYHSNAAASI